MGKNRRHSSFSKIRNAVPHPFPYACGTNMLKHTALRTRQLRQAYDLMRAHFGHLHWWPGETPFEVCVGAILTQNTAWTNVEKALHQLKQAKALDPRKMYALPPAKLAELIRPAGYFNIKTKRLRAFLKVLLEDFGGSLTKLMQGPTPLVRERLLAVNGIGPETADSMLLYASTHLSFVIDAYTKRIFSRHGWCAEDITYHELQTLCVNALSQKAPGEQLDYWQDYHAQLVMIGKDYCRPKNPRCDTCPLQCVLPG
jgi:endonuclease III related protein